jgi:hypothetical protein
MNEQASAFYYNYYPEQFYYVEDKENCAALTSQAQLPVQRAEDREALQFSAGKQSRHNETTPEKVKINEELPSVSPLVKRYNYHENNSTQSVSFA